MTGSIGCEQAEAAKLIEPDLYIELTDKEQAEKQKEVIDDAVALEPDPPK